MPRRIAREEALRRIGAADACVPCGWSRAASPLAESEHAVAVLSRYPIRWGHALVVLRDHAERFAEVSPEAWADAARLAHRVAAAVERALEPERCYVASLGTSEPGLPMTFAHLHFNVIPVYRRGARPREVLTWRHGIFEGTEAEWGELRARLEAELG